MTPRRERDTALHCPDCGWAGRPTTAGLAAYALRKHSCDKQRQRDASRARGRTRAAAIDRTPKPCQHKQANHQHGTYAAYVLDQCRCEPCAHANRTYEKQRVRQQAYGRWNGLVDADPARQHVAQLRAAGVGLKRIAAISGVPHGSLWKLVYGKPRPDGTQTPSKRCRPETARRILAVTVTLEDLGTRRPVEGTGTRRRLQALVALGWSISELGRRLGITNIHRTIGSDYVWAETARAVRAVYDGLWDQAPPESNQRERIAASRARRYAAARDWPPPMAWDDDTIDDPAARPDLGARARRSEALAENWVELARQGYTRDQAADRLGVTRTNLDQAVKRNRVDGAA